MYPEKMRRRWRCVLIIQPLRLGFLYLVFRFHLEGVGDPGQSKWIGNGNLCIVFNVQLIYLDIPIGSFSPFPHCGIQHHISMTVSAILVGIDILVLLSWSHN
jgi:hypothetical protein